jgi:hypothetical protein
MPSPPDRREPPCRRRKYTAAANIPPSPFARAAITTSPGTGHKFERNLCDANRDKDSPAGKANRLATAWHTPANLLSTIISCVASHHPAGIARSAAATPTGATTAARPDHDTRSRDATTAPVLLAHSKSRCSAMVKIADVRFKEDRASPTTMVGPAIDPPVALSEHVLLIGWPSSRLFDQR